MEKRTTTDDLAATLMQASDLSEFLDENKERFVEKPNIPEYIERLLVEKDITKYQLIRETNIEYRFAYKIISGDRKISRNNAIRFCLAFRLTPKEADRFLKFANVGGLYARDLRDAVIIYSLEKHMTVAEVNDMLSRKEYPTI